MRVRVNALLAAAQANSLNIGTADHLARAAAPGGITPGEIINWAIRMNSEQMRSAANAVQLPVKGSYPDLARDEPINMLNNSWTGIGSDAFVSRWDVFKHYIGTEESGAHGRLKQQVGAMHDLADQIDEFHSTILESLNSSSGIGGVREAYVAALCETGEKAAMENMLIQAGLGVTLGGAGPKQTDKLGGAVAGLFGLIEGFVKASLQRLSAIADQGVSINQLAEGWFKTGDALTLRARSQDKSVDLGYQGYSPPPSDFAGTWDEAFNREWEPSL